MAIFTINNAATQDIGSLTVLLDDRQSSKVQFLFSNKIEQGNSTVNLIGLPQDIIIGLLPMVWNTGSFNPDKIYINSVTTINEIEGSPSIVYTPDLGTLPQNFPLAYAEEDQKEIFSVLVNFMSTSVTWSITIHITVEDSLTNVSINKEVNINFSPPVIP